MEPEELEAEKELMRMIDARMRDLLPMVRVARHGGGPPLAGHGSFSASGLSDEDVARQYAEREIRSLRRCVGAAWVRADWAAQSREMAPRNVRALLENVRASLAEIDHGSRGATYLRALAVNLERELSGETP